MPVIEDITNAIKIQIKSLMPVNLDKECEKAAKTLEGFVFDSNLQLKNPIISPETIKKAKGLVILTIGKAGISFTIRGGSGILISRLPDGTWSAPSALKTGGFGVGSQIGAEIIELVMVLTTEEAIKNFCENENITLGGNLSVAIGEVGRSAEINSTVKNVSAIISYGKSKGVYFGMSVEGAVIQQNDEANATAYGKDVTVENILQGNVEKPAYATPLYDVLERIEQSCKSKKISDEKTEKKTLEKTEEKKDEKKETKTNTDTSSNEKPNANEEPEKAEDSKNEKSDDKKTQ